MPRSSRPLLPQIYQLKVTLYEVEPPVWRRLLVPGDLTFGQLHLVLQEAMGWQNCHLHEFEIGDRRIGEPSDEWSNDLQPDDERRIRLAKGLPEVGASFLYKYDFGDGWKHEILVEKLDAHDPRVAYPLCIAGARACPPEDCGAASGYHQLLIKLADAQDEEHDHMVAWVGGLFDPAGFDVNRTNAAIRGIRQLRRARR